MNIELIVVPRTDHITHVKLVGRLDMLAMKTVDVRFHGETAARDQSTIVDLSQLEFITSLGIGMLFGCAKSLRRKNRTMVLLGCTGFVDSALRTVGVHEVIPLASTMEEALGMARDAGS
jgi:anti-sigma B factor antagonist